MTYELEVEVLKAKLAVLEAERDEPRITSRNISDAGMARIAQSDAVSEMITEMYKQMIKLLTHLDIQHVDDVSADETVQSLSASSMD